MLGGATTNSVDTCQQRQLHRTTISLPFQAILSHVHVTNYNNMLYSTESSMEKIFAMSSYLYIAVIFSGINFLPRRYWLPYPLCNH